MKRLITLVLAICMLALLVGCSNQENEIGDINNYTPIALLDDVVVYNYIDDDALVIGRYELSSSKSGTWSFSEKFDWTKIVNDLMQSSYHYGDLKGYMEWKKFLGFLDK